MPPHAVPPTNAGKLLLMPSHRIQTNPTTALVMPSPEFKRQTIGFG
jgi:hypothetical protein